MCSKNCIRVVFGIFNAIFWLLGLAVLGIGIYSKIQTDTWRELIETNAILEATTLLIVAGAIVAVVGFLGCCGAIKKWRPMLVIYAILVLAILGLEVAAGVYTYVNREKVENTLTSGLQKGIKENYGEDDDITNEAITVAIDWFQENVECCGAAGPGDWAGSAWDNDNTTTGDVPTSCCVDDDVAGCNVGITANSTTIYQTGCVEQGKLFVKDNLAIVIGVGIGVGAAQIFAVVLALCLCRMITKDVNDVDIA